MKQKKKVARLRRQIVHVSEAPVVRQKPRPCPTAHDLFVENLRHYWRKVLPVRQGQYRDGEVASFVLRRSFSRGYTTL